MCVGQSRRLSSSLPQFFEKVLAQCSQFELSGAGCAGEFPVQTRSGFSVLFPHFLFHCFSLFTIRLQLRPQFFHSHPLFSLRSRALARAVIHVPPPLRPRLERRGEHCVEIYDFGMLAIFRACKLRCPRFFPGRFLLSFLVGPFFLRSSDGFRLSLSCIRDEIISVCKQDTLVACYTNEGSRFSTLVKSMQNYLPSVYVELLLLV